MRIMFLGDTHSNLRWVVDHVLPTAERQDVDLILQLGDWGFMWPGHDTYQELNAALAHTNIPMWTLDGNHDEHPRLHALPIRDDGVTMIASHLRYLRRGERFKLDGLRFLTLGGAYSLDKDWRTPGKSWWPEETITAEEEELAIAGGKCDVMLTHDKPRASRPQWNRKDLIVCWPNQEAVQAVVDATRPKFLLHAHLHHAYYDRLILAGGHVTAVQGLNCDGNRDAMLVVDTATLRSIHAYEGKHVNAKSAGT